jgi:methylated-DNA-[protein]-cysteine S-methyltransferase
MQYSSFYQSPLGVLKITCTDTFVVSVEFCDHSGDNEQHHLLQEVNLQMDEYFLGTRRQFDFAMQQIGTPFQIKVWDLLSAIPYGKTISYQQLAKEYGDVLSIRAIAAANGRNKLAIVTPCHRVIGSGGSLTGYAGGLWRKKWLLDHELKHSGVQQLQIF